MDEPHRVLLYTVNYAQKEEIPMLQEVNIITQAFVNGLIHILREKLHGVYIYGAAAFHDAVPTGDIDFHVILKS